MSRDLILVRTAIRDAERIIITEREILMKQYKTVAGPKNISVAKGDTQSAFNTFAEIINREAVGGWEYHSMETITVTEKPGCFQQPVSLNYYMLIFVKEN